VEKGQCHDGGKRFARWTEGGGDFTVIMEGEEERRKKEPLKAVRAAGTVVNHCTEKKKGTEKWADPHKKKGRQRTEKNDGPGDHHSKRNHMVTLQNGGA